MPCFTAPVRNNQILMNVFITAFVPGGGDGAVAIDAENSFGALVDTGATKSCISPRAAQKAGIASVGKGEMHTAGGLVPANVYDINLHIPVVVGITKEDKQTVSLKNFLEMRVGEASMPEHFDVLLGMDVIMGGGLHVSGGSFTFCT